MDEWQQIHAARRILGLPETASFFEVKAAYRRMIKRFHPDRTKSSEPSRDLEQVTLAYQVLERFWEHLPIPFDAKQINLLLQRPRRGNWLQSMLGR